MQLSSRDFEHGHIIPLEFTCLGQNINPSLEITDIPNSVKSMVLFLYDADSSPIWTHWLVFNIPATTRFIPANNIPAGAVEGLANNKSFGYEGPCPRYFQGTHHYWFRLYGLDIQLSLEKYSDRNDVEKAMKDHIITEAYLLGLCNAMAPEFLNSK